MRKSGTWHSLLQGLVSELVALLGVEGTVAISIVLGPNVFDDLSDLVEAIT